MRKLLLASAALIGGATGLAQVANAEALVNLQEPAGLPNALPPPWAVGTVFPTTAPQMPGTMTVRIAARVLAYALAGYDSGRSPVVTPNVPNPAITPGTTLPAAGTVAIGDPASNGKLGAYNFMSYARIYPQVDGVAANGLKYGGFLEIRQDQTAPPGGGANSSPSSDVKNRAALYFRREFGYVGTDQLGTLKFGSVDQATSLYMTGSMETFDDGAWNGDVPAFFTQNSAPAWPFPDVGNMYTTAKIAYSSPAFGPIDFGMSYEPTTGGMDDTAGNCPYSVTATSGINGPVSSTNGLGCDDTTSTTSADNKRRRNVFEALVRLRTAVGPVGIVATIGGDVGGKVNDSTYHAPGTKFVAYDNFSFLDAGLQLTFGGLMVGAHLDYGAINGGGGWETKVSGEPNTLMYTAGAQYAWGPFDVGGSYWNEFSEGSQTNLTVPAVGRLDANGWAVGSAYQFAPGMIVFLSALYGAKHERGVDLLSGATSSAALGTVVTNNNTKAAGVGLGTLFKW